MEEGTKKLLKKIAIIVLVPTAVVVTYYGAKFVHKKYKENKAKKEGDKNTDTNNTENKGKDNSTEGGNDNSARASVKLNKDGSVDTTGMVNYTISIPFKLQKELFTDGKFFDEILKVNYSFKNEVVEGDMIKVNIMALPKDLRQLNYLVKKLNNEITISPTISPIVT